MTMSQIELSAGTIEYEDTGGKGPAIVLLPGLMMDASRLAELLPQGRLVEIPDGYTLIPLDQPARLGEAIQQFTHESDGGTR
jgi:pimeloyl-ACP methyl ester carboxylesterase